MSNVIASRNQIVDELAERYEQQGYRVKVAPENTDMPDFLRGYRPDLVALSSDHSDRGVVVEVKSPGKVRRINYWKELAEVVRNHQGWHFELIVDNSPDLEALSLEEAEHLLKQSERLADDGYTVAALMLAWTVTEAAMRERLESAHVELKQVTPLILATTLRNEGFLDLDEYQFLKDCAQVRNKVAHGFREVVLPQTVHILVNAARQLLLPEGDAQPFLSAK